MLFLHEKGHIFISLELSGHSNSSAGLAAGHFAPVRQVWAVPPALAQLTVLCDECAAHQGRAGFSI